MIDEEEVEDALFWASLHGITQVEFKTMRQWLADGGYVPPANTPDDRAHMAVLPDSFVHISRCSLSTNHEYSSRSLR